MWGLPESPPTQNTTHTTTEFPVTLRRCLCAGSLPTRHAGGKRVSSATVVTTPAGLCEVYVFCTQYSARWCRKKSQPPLCHLRVYGLRIIYQPSQGTSSVLMTRLFLFSLFLPLWRGRSQVFVSDKTRLESQFFHSLMCDLDPTVTQFPDNSVGKESACNAGDPGLIPGSGRSVGEGIGYPVRDSWTSLVAQLVKNLPAMQETLV